MSNFYKEKINVEELINGKAINSIDLVVNEAFILATTEGIVPVKTGKTKNTTEKAFKNSSGVFEGGVYTQTKYSPLVYEKNKTGRSKWLEFSFEKSPKTIENEMRV